MYFVLSKVFRELICLSNPRYLFSEKLISIQNSLVKVMACIKTTL